MKIDWIMLVSGCIILISTLILITSYSLYIEWLTLVGILLLFGSGFTSLIRGTRQLLNEKKTAKNRGRSQ